MADTPDRDAAGEPPTAAVPQEHGQGWRWALLATVPVLVLRAGTMSESDTFWAVRTGLLTLETRSLPTRDPFSWTAHGQPWTLNSWGFNVLLALAHGLDGLRGVALLGAAQCLVVSGLSLVLARRLGAAPQVAGAVLVATLVLLLAWLSVRPHLVDYLAVVVLVVVLHRIERGWAGWQPMLAAAALFLVWVNLHAGALLGVSVAAAASAALLARKATRPAGRWCVAATAVGLVTSMLNPRGVGLLAQTLEVQGASAELVDEWRHLDVGDPFQLVLVVIGLGALLLAWRRREPVLVATLATLLVGSVAAVRLQPVLVLVAAPLLAAAWSTPAVLGYLRSRRLVLYPGAAALLGVITVMAGAAVPHLGRPEPSLYPVALLPEIPHGCRLFNSYAVGGLVILERPDVQVSIDSRNDVYGRALVADNARIIGEGDDRDPQVAQAGCALVPTTSALARRLADDGDWDRRGSTEGGVLYVRR